MERLPLYVYIHPVWQLATLVVGLIVAATALPNVDNPNFRVRQHERLGRILMILLLAGAVFGKLVVTTLPPGTFQIPGHRFVGSAIVILSVIGAIFGYQGGRLRLRTRTAAMRAHPWFIILAVALIIGQGIAAMGTKGLRFIKF
jgi:hypothetical protein